MSSRSERFAKLMAKARKARARKKRSEVKADLIAPKRVEPVPAGQGKSVAPGVAPEAAERSYHLLHLRDHTCVRVDTIDAEDDAAAVQLAENVVREGAAELWIDARRVREFPSC